MKRPAARQPNHPPQQPAELPLRHIHLDFHTPADVGPIAAGFDADAFADALAAARVNAINLFARCHHGWMYYPSRLFPERVHPGLGRLDLLGRQVEACHARSIQAAAYTTVQWDDFTAQRHPEWRVVNPDGRLEGTPPYEPGFYRGLCLNSPFRQFMSEHVSELLEMAPLDGLFFDIVLLRDCSCGHCRRGMRERGLKPDDAAARIRFGYQTLQEWMREMAARVRRLSPACRVFFNQGHVGVMSAEVADAFTHFELESLPSGGWGYMHFPVAQRFARTLGRPTVGMTGKFHTSWGDFHSYKNPAALEFECFQMLALGAGCCVGDQLHPDGRLCPATYRLIGDVYRQVEAKEPWCRRAAPVTELAVLNPEAFIAPGQRKSLTPAASGAVRMLQELAQQFDLVGSEADLAGYKLVVLPDEIPLDAALAARLRRFVRAGGAILATGRGGLTPDARRFALRELGVRLVGPAPWNPDFLVPGAALAYALPAGRYVMYDRGMEVRPTAGAEVLAEVEAPYYNRTWEHYFSHRHAPSCGRLAYPGAVANGRCVYLAHPVFSLYDAKAPLWCKQLVRACLDRLLPQPLVRLTAPSSTIATLNHQRHERRYVLHLLHYVPERRGREIDVIEDVLSVHDVGISLKLPRPVRSARLVPQGRPLKLARRRGRLELTLPVLRGHQMIELA